VAALSFSFHQDVSKNESGWQDLNLQQPAPKAEQIRPHSTNPAALLLSGMVEKPSETAGFEPHGGKLSGETQNAAEIALDVLLRARADGIAAELLN
jgi:hypothetical protein